MMNEKQRQAIKARQRQRAAELTAENPDAPPAEPEAPPRPFEEEVAEKRPDVGPGTAVAYLKFVDKTFQVAGMQSGDRIDARTQPNGREHRLELVRDLDCFLVTYLDPARRIVEFDLVERSAVKVWRLA